MLHTLIPEMKPWFAFTQHAALLSASQVELNECVRCEFTFINTGKFTFSFQAELSGPKALLQYLEFSPIDGSVDVGQSTAASLSFHPFKTCVLKGLELRIKVRPFNMASTECTHSILSWEINSPVCSWYSPPRQKLLESGSVVEIVPQSLL